MNVRSGYGVGWGDEMLAQFTFPMLASPADKGPATSRDVKVSQRMTKVWAEFVATGSPNSSKETKKAAKTTKKTSDKTEKEEFVWNASSLPERR
jgi:carboxylesterase type B